MDIVNLTKNERFKNLSVDFSYTLTNVKLKKNGIITADNQLMSFFNNLKDSIVQFTFKNSKEIFGVQKSLQTLSEFYHNPLNQFGMVSYQFGRVSLCVNGIDIVGPINGNIIIKNIWYSSKSYGPIVFLENVTEYRDNMFQLFNCSDSDSDSDLEIDFNSDLK